MRAAYAVKKQIEEDTSTIYIRGSANSLVRRIFRADKVESRKQIALQQEHGFYSIQLEQNQGLARLTIEQEQAKMFADLIQEQQTDRATSILMSLDNLGIFDCQKLLSNSNSLPIMMNVLQYIIDSPACPKWMISRNLLYIANNLSGEYCKKTKQRKGQFARFINHDVLTCEYFESLGIKYVEEKTISLLPAVVNAQRLPSAGKAVKKLSPESLSSSSCLISPRSSFSTLPSLCKAPPAVVSTSSNGSDRTQVARMPALVAR